MYIMSIKWCSRLETCFIDRLCWTRVVNNDEIKIANGKTNNNRHSTVMADRGFMQFQMSYDQ